MVNPVVVELTPITIINFLLKEMLMGAAEDKKKLLLDVKNNFELGVNHEWFRI